MEYVWHVDEEDRPIGKVTRKDMREKNLLHRVVDIFVRNKRGQILVHKRTMTKDMYPGRYDLVVGGTVTYGESYEEAAARELLEEIGARTSLRFLWKDRFKDKKNDKWSNYYETVFDGPLKLQASEVEWAKFMDIDEAKELMKKESFMPDSVKNFPRYLKSRGSK